MDVCADADKTDRRGYCDEGLSELNFIKMSVNTLWRKTILEEISGTGTRLD